MLTFPGAFRVSRLKMRLGNVSIFVHEHSVANILKFLSPWVRIRCSARSLDSIQTVPSLSRLPQLIRFSTISNPLHGAFGSGSACFSKFRECR